MMNDTLILVDIQRDFLPGGSLAVPNGDAVVPVANRLAPHFRRVIATQDWHPRNHGSFAGNHAGKRPAEFIKLGGMDQILWPVHCVQGSSGAEFAPGLVRGSITRVVRKGTDPEIDSYSGFFDNGHLKATGLEALLRGTGVRRVHVMGLATDYCVKFTALDARRVGLEVVLVADGCRAVNLARGDGDHAIAAMLAAGVGITTSAAILSAA